MTEITTLHYLVVAASLFIIGTIGVLTRRNVIIILMSIELILNAVNLNLVAFSRLYGLHGQWEVENSGISPDIEVENDPASVAGGHDPQLEKAVQVTLDALKKNPVVIPDHPPYPNYHQK